MKLNTRLTLSAFILGLVLVAIPFTANWHLPLLNGAVVTWIENGQALWLLFGAVFTFCYIRPLSRPAGEKQFWLWAAVWWLVLLGRSTSWGRDYFPEHPKLLFRAISVVLIAMIILPVLLSKHLRQDIARRLRNEPLPLWLLAITVCAFLISDTVEHHRLLAPVFLHNASYGDLIEELYELPFMVGLFLMNLGFMQRDKQHEPAAICFSEPHLAK
ncbi:MULTISPECIES: hypothetical protein [Citrobacter]|uniref:Nitric oxide reductase n=1 Tax=Citrobacter cronae TaxID=1748967 RepID=A0ABS1A547_9ENTR|nr:MULTISPECIES: hypothetical protein [Citrobacter]AHY12960.1 membrane protein [Citrobacter freundii CFNIH1]AWS97277.1 hypothetical protein AN232_19655 [Citrobacter sp. CRE-46]KAA0557136.1 hypothetical protein F0329_11810 [Citrobacter werkmanii]MBD0818216.1 hypothetical protein [Citrobacter sp. C5_2]MBJ8383943.1 hypothetical protein [Citrobacter cronae]